MWMAVDDFYRFYSSNLFHLKTRIVTNVIIFSALHFFIIYLSDWHIANCRHWQ